MNVNITIMPFLIIYIDIIRNTTHHLFKIISCLKHVNITIIPSQYYINQDIIEKV